MQTRPKTNSRYYIICEMKQQLSPQKINGTCGITGLSIDIKYCKLACAKWWQRSARDVAMWPCRLIHLFVNVFVRSFVRSSIHSFIDSLPTFFLCVFFIVASAHCMFMICLTYPVVCDSCLISLCLFYTLNYEVRYLSIALLSFVQANIKLCILERLARFVRIKSCFHKDDTIGTVLHVAMTWSQTKSWLMAH